MLRKMLVWKEQGSWHRGHTFNIPGRCLIPEGIQLIFVVIHNIPGPVAIPSVKEGILIPSTAEDFISE